MEDLPLGRIAALVPESAVMDLPLDRTLNIAYIYAHCIANFSPNRNVEICPESVLNDNS